MVIYCLKYSKAQQNGSSSYCKFSFKILVSPKHIVAA